MLDITIMKSSAVGRTEETFGKFDIVERVPVVGRKLPDYERTLVREMLRETSVQSTITYRGIPVVVTDHPEMFSIVRLPKGLVPTPLSIDARLVGDALRVSPNMLKPTRSPSERMAQETAECVRYLLEATEQAMLDHLWGRR